MPRRANVHRHAGYPSFERRASFVAPTNFIMPEMKEESHAWCNVESTWCLCGSNPISIDCDYNGVICEDDFEEPSPTVPISLKFEEGMTRRVTLESPRSPHETRYGIAKDEILMIKENEMIKNRSIFVTPPTSPIERNQNILMATDCFKLRPQKSVARIHEDPQSDDSSIPTKPRNPRNLIRRKTWPGKPPNRKSLLRRVKSTLGNRRERAIFLLQDLNADLRAKLQIGNDH